jgi:hypothetical protein
MLKQSIYISIVVALLSVTATADHNEKENNRQSSHKHYKKKGQSQQNIENQETYELTSAQKEGLLYMLEEEKLAKDVYTSLYGKWNLHIFSKISKSEEKHVNAVSNLLTKYNLEFPSTFNRVGKFKNEQLQALYDELMERGNDSQIEALEVGVLIEETDINDLDELISNGLSDDVEKVYKKLLNGSHKHLDAFNRQLSIE